MQRFFTIFIFLTLISCQDKVICPAFQSTYILDDSTRRAYFSYVWQLDETTRNEILAKKTGVATPPTAVVEDTIASTLPAYVSETAARPDVDYYAYAGEKIVPWRTPKKTKNGIIKRVPYPLKNYRLRTAPMENVLGPEIPDNNAAYVADGYDPTQFGDSLSYDSAARIAFLQAQKQKKKSPSYLYRYDPGDNYNVEQQYYNKYFSYKFFDETPKASDIAGNEPLTQDTVAQKKTPFFKRLFKKKEKEVDSVAVDDQPVEVSDASQDNSGGE